MSDCQQGATVLILVDSGCDFCAKDLDKPTPFRACSVHYPQARAHIAEAGVPYVEI